MPAVDPASLLWFLPLTVPIALWVAWSDMKFMKIPNKAVLALAGVYLVAGPMILPLETWAWGWALLAIVLLTGFLVSSMGLVGAGDAKFAAAMAPFFIGADIRLVLVLFSACLIAAFVSHRAARSVPALRAVTSDWVSWTHRKFPMGLALGGILVIYPLLAFWLARGA